MRWTPQAPGEQADTTLAAYQAVFTEPSAMTIQSIRLISCDAVPAGRVYVIDPQLFLTDPTDANIARLAAAIFMSHRTQGGIFVKVDRTAEAARRARLRRMHTAYSRRRR